MNVYIPLFLFNLHITSNIHCQLRHFSCDVEGASGNVPQEFDRDGPQDEDGTYCDDDDDDSGDSVDDDDHDDDDDVDDGGGGGGDDSGNYDDHHHYYVLHVGTIVFI